MEFEGGSAPAVLQSARGVVLGSGHQSPTAGITDPVSSLQGQGARSPFPLDKSRPEGQPGEDTATESESEPETVELGPGDSVSQRLPAVPLPLRYPPTPTPAPIPKTLHKAGKPCRSNDVPMGSDTATIDESGASDSNSDSDDGVQATHARKRRRLAKPPQGAHLPPARQSHIGVLAQHSYASNAHHHPRRSTPAGPTPPIFPQSAQTASQTHHSTSLLSLGPSKAPLASDLDAWAAQLAKALARESVTDDQVVGTSHRADRTDLVSNLVTKIVANLHSNFPITAPGQRAKAHQPPSWLKHTDFVEDDAMLLEAEAALSLGKRVRPRHKPTLADFPGAYEVFGTLCEFAEDTYIKVWSRELENVQVQRPLQALTSLMVHRISWFRGGTKVQIRPVVPFVYPFINPPRTREDLLHNRELVDKLLPSAFYCTDIDNPDDEQYEHPALQVCIAAAFFSGPDSIGAIYRDKFRPIPLPAVAMVLTVLQHCIKEWSTGRFVARELNAGKQYKVYKAHLKGLLEYAKPAGKQLRTFQREWFEYALNYAGTVPEEEELCQPITRADRVRPDTPDHDAGAEAHSYSVAEGKRRASH